jgi:integrase
MIQVQFLTACRPGEVVNMRPVDVDRTGDIWTYHPPMHKTQHHGHQREIFLSPSVQALLTPFLLRPKAAFCFSPAEAVAEMRARRRAARQTPDSCGNRPGSNVKRKPTKVPSKDYTVHAYNAAVRRACKTLDIPTWHVHQLRHSRATQLRSVVGLELTRQILGHRSIPVTELYAQADRAKVLKAVRKMEAVEGL